MSLRSFEYIEPSSLEEAVAFLGQHHSQAKAVAGGTDLLVQMKHRLRNPQILLALKSIPSLDYIEFDGRTLSIGATASLRSIESSSIVQERFPMLAGAVHTIGSIQIRNLGTLVGNLCHASPAADSAPSLLCLEARVKIISGSGSRVVDLENFFVGPGKTILESDELVQEVQIPVPASNMAGTYVKHSPRRGMDLAQVGVATALVFDGARAANVRIALGAVASTVKRAKKAEAALEGKAPSDELISEVAKIAAEESEPISDIRASAEYRRKMVEVQTKRALRQILQPSSR